MGPSFLGRTAYVKKPYSLCRLSSRIGLSLLAVLLSIESWIAPWPSFVIISALALLAVASLERIQPYQSAWLENHQDLIPDIGHAIGSLGLLSLTAWGLHIARMDIRSRWPEALPRSDFKSYWREQ